MIASIVITQSQVTGLYVSETFLDEVAIIQASLTNLGVVIAAMSDIMIIY